MNFKELAKKLKEIQDGHEMDVESNLESAVDECGGMEMPISMISPNQEQSAGDNMNMNVTINSKGADGIRDLMNILKGISGEVEQPHEHEPETKEIVIGDDFKNAVHGDKGPKVFGLDSAIFTGNDLASKGGEAPKQAGGGNPWKIRNESLVNNLTSLYEEVKGRSQKKR